MNGLRGWIVFAWIALPTVMYGGYSLIEFIKRGNVLTPTQVSFFRAGHAHAGVLTLMSLLYYAFLDQTSLPLPVNTRLAQLSSSASSLSQAASLSTFSPNGQHLAPRSL